MKQRALQTGVAVSFQPTPKSQDKFTSQEVASEVRVNAASECSTHSTYSLFSCLMPVKAFNMQRVVQVVQLVQMAAQKSCRRACELFCFQLDTMLCENVNCCPAQNHQQNEDKTTQVALPSPPSTILIVNISNSTLIDCVIGNDTYKTGVAESQPLMQEPDLHMHDQSCSCNHGEQGTEHTSPLPAPLPHCPVSPEEPGINIHSSHLNCVIIGDNNYMHAEQIHRCDALTENTHS